MRPRLNGSLAALMAATTTMVVTAATLAMAEPAQAPAVTTATLDPARMLPPPPADGSPTQAAELRELHAIQSQRTPDRLRQATADAALGDASIFAVVLGPRFDLGRLPVTAALLGRLRRAQVTVTGRGKNEFGRLRPWAVDPTLVGCSHLGDASNTSYPSGHTTLAFSQGVVLADLIPAKAPAILRRAADFGYSREVCGLHYPSDVNAGQVLGTAVAETFLHDPANQGDITAARAELRAAGF